MRRWAVKVLAEFGVIGGTLWIAVHWGFWAYPLALVILGTRQLALAVLGHDAIHGHAGAAGKILAVLCFWPLGFGRDGFCWQHFRHHARPGQPDDPEMPLRRQNLRAKRFGRWLWLLDICGYSLTQAWVWFVRVARPRSVEDIVGPLTVLAAFVYLAPWPAVILWFAAVLVFGAVSRQRAYTDHDGLVTLSMAEPALWKRLLYLPHGTWLHWEHHRWPALPVHILRTK